MINEGEARVGALSAGRGTGADRVEPYPSRRGVFSVGFRFFRSSEGACRGPCPTPLGARLGRLRSTLLLASLRLWDTQVAALRAAPLVLGVSSAPRGPP